MFPRCCTKSLSFNREGVSQDAIMSIHLEMPNWRSLIIITSASIIGGLIIRLVVLENEE